MPQKKYVYMYICMIVCVCIFVGWLFVCLFVCLSMFVSLSLSQSPYRSLSIRSWTRGESSVGDVRIAGELRLMMCEAI